MTAFEYFGVETELGVFWFGVVCGLLFAGAVAFAAWLVEGDDGDSDAHSGRS